MAVSCPNLLFYVQAGASVGMGHLARSAALINSLDELGKNVSLFLDADSHGHSVASSYGLRPLSSLPNGPGVLIIDAINLPGKNINWANNFYPRILLSPIFNRIDIATHLLVRDAPQCLRSKLNKKASLIIKPDFAFATANGFSRKKLSYECLTVGICLSAGDDPLDIQKVVNAVANVPQVIEIRVIDRRKVLRCLSRGFTLSCVPPRTDPWAFLEGINIFIGGDGVMLAEAIAQAIPAISLTTGERKEKNQALSASGVIKNVSRNENGLHELTEILADKVKLMNMHMHSWNMNGPCRAKALKDNLIAILDGEHL